jgi:hypothetical protein
MNFCESWGRKNRLFLIISDGWRPGRGRLAGPARDTSPHVRGPVHAPPGAHPSGGAGVWKATSRRRPEEAGEARQPAHELGRGGGLTHSRGCPRAARSTSSSSAS